ncbi:MAG: hypothetical protein NTZ16_04960 [Verrucomicrobia bacterium]|nr:hypothetical protein [Verrucomicrobiota bacterium]
MLSVAGLYNDPVTREQVLAIGDRLAARFASELRFDFHWWRTALLDDPLLARHAAAEVARADIVLIDCGPAENFSSALLNWFEDWIAGRDQPDGVLFDLTPTGTTSPAAALHTRFYFQNIAHRANMDYLTITPETAPSRLASRFGNATAATITMSALPPSPEYQPPPPSHFGLNE